MDHAESVTFGSSALNRASELRNAESQVVLRAQNNVRVTLFWRGKPLLREKDDQNLRLAWVDLNHEFMTYQLGSLIFLGLDEEE